MAITHAATLMEADHGLVFLKTDDNEIHCLEYGQHHDKEEKHDHHDPTHTHIQHHHKQHEHHHEHQEEHAEHTHDYHVHLWSPIGARPGKCEIPTNWSAATSKETPEELNHRLKHEWHQHKGEKVFHDADTFVHHVMKDQLKA